MNAVEIEEAISALAELPFDGDEFPFAFLLAFGNKATTIKMLRKGARNKSDLAGVLQTNKIHLKVCAEGEVTNSLAELKASPATTRAKAKFVLATDGRDLEAEDLTTGETIACAYTDFPDHFGFFLPLAGISTVKQIRESTFDIKATGRLNRLYVELLKDNPEWGTAARRHDMNHFMARLIFCFFAEDTDIFTTPDQFTGTIERMSEKDSSNTHEVISELFRAMNTKADDRTAAGIARWANVFPYVNGGLFSGGTDVPRFSKIARSYLIHIGSLDWTKINPDIFGSMIQAVILDLHSRRVIGWAVSNRMKRDLAIRALNMAIAFRSPPKGCIHHTDRGSQYCSHDYQKILRQHGFKVSMSGKGNCYDNAAVETFFKTIKAELIWRRSWETRRQAEMAIFEYINGFYNPRRRHSALGWKSPVAFERKVA